MFTIAIMRKNNKIYVKSLNYDIILDPNDFDKSKRYPFQIIEDGAAKWITLLKDINFENHTYGATGLFHNGAHIVSSWVSDLYNRLGQAKFSVGDIIRNPTDKEMQAIHIILKNKGYRYNRKTNKLIDIEKIDLPF